MLDKKGNKLNCLGNCYGYVEIEDRFEQPIAAEGRDCNNSRWQA
jgi:hypothetical protein